MLFFGKKNVNIFRKCYFLERKMFLCVWLSQNLFYGKSISVFGIRNEVSLANKVTITPQIMVTVRKRAVESKKQRKLK